MSEHDVEFVTYRRSDELAALFTALAKAQGVFSSASKVGENPAFKSGGNPSKYATLESVIEATKEGRSTYGLALLQMPSNVGESVAVTTMLGHGESGQWIESTFAVRPLKFDAQGAGSALTYLRRYAMMSILGIAPADDDGNAASLSAPQPPTNTAHRPINPPPAIQAPPPPEPPHDPVTGEIKPIAIPFDDTWVAWGGRYIAGIKAANSLDELDEWDRLNAASLDVMAKKSPKAYASVKAAAQAATNKINLAMDAEFADQTNVLK